MKPKCLLYLPTPGGLTGAPRRLLTLAGVLREKGFQVYIAANESSDLLREARRLDFDVLAVNPVGGLELRGGGLFSGGIGFRLQTLWALLRQNLRFRKAVRQCRADVVWLRASKGVVFGGFGAWLARTKIVWDVAYELPSKGLVRLIHLFGLACSDQVMFQYSAAPELVFGRKLARKYSYKFSPIVPGIDLSALDSFRSPLIPSTNADVRPFVILQVGTLCDRKNQLFLLRVLSSIDKRAVSRPVVVKLAGEATDPGYVHSLEREIVQGTLSENVEFLGWRNDVHELMAGADILVMPSKDEGVPNTVQEAMYIGLPVLASDAGGMPELIDHDMTGWLLPLDRDDEWKATICMCIGNPDKVLSVASEARDYASEKFGTKEWGNQYTSRIRSIIENTGAVDN